MTDTPYNIAPLGLFGKRCRILTGYNKRPFVYRIVNSELISNTWSEPPITYQSEKNPIRHDYSVNVLIVVLDTLISEDSRLIRVALKDVELMDEASTVDSWISVKDRLPVETHSIFWFWYGKKEWSKAMWREQSDKVLVTVAFKDGTRTVTTGETHDGVWNTTISRALEPVVTHWMPLPEPPKKENDDEDAKP